MHSAADQHGGRLPGARVPFSVSAYEPEYYQLFHTGLYQYLELAPYQEGRVRVFISPADPTVSLVSTPTMQPTSYVPNWTAVSDAKVVGGVRDGLSQTIAVSERYFATCNPESSLVARVPLFRCQANVSVEVAPEPSGPPLTRPNLLGGRHTSFACRMFLDVVPVTDPVTGATRASDRGQTFQVRPRPEEASTFVVQTPFAAGLPVALFDGSVRVLSPGISESTFWAMVTPAAGDVPGDF